jgi:hypothetical protein
LYWKLVKFSRFWRWISPAEITVTGVGTVWTFSERLRAVTITSSMRESESALGAAGSAAGRSAARAWATVSSMLLENRKARPCFRRDVWIDIGTSPTVLASRRKQTRRRDIRIANIGARRCAQSQDCLGTDPRFDQNSDAQRL